jgi:hypothetical protein
MNVEIGTEASQFPEKEYINGIFVAVYNYSHWKGRGKAGRVEPERRGGGQHRRVQITSWFENTIMTECTQEIGYLQSINSDKYLPQSPFTGQFFYVDILHCLL